MNITEQTARAAERSIAIMLIPRPNGIVGVTVQHCRTGCGRTLLYTHAQLADMVIDGVGMEIDHALQDIK